MRARVSSQILNRGSGCENDGDNGKEITGALHIRQHEELSSKQYATSNKYDTKCYALRGALPLMYVSYGEVMEPSSSSAVSAGMATPDWSGFQAYSPMPPHGYVASSPQPHLYMWGVQHMMMPPYGTPPPPMYPPGGMYGHPSSLPPGSYPYSPYGMAEASGNTEGGGSKQAEVKEKLPIKRSKGSLGSLNMIIGKNNDTGKNSCSKRHVTSRYAESASDGSSEGNDADSQNDSGSRNNGKDASDSAHGPLRAHGSNQPANQIVPIIAY
ncbi:hypothetical protein F2Q70_00038942, partial [Brassica cretica]